MKAKYDVNMKKVWTGEFRLSYPNLFNREKSMDVGKEGKYSLTMLIPKTDKETYEALKQLLTDTAKAKFGATLPKGLKTPIRDGDSETDNPNKSPEKLGHWVVKATTNDRPGVILADKTNAEPRDLYPGCYCRATLRSFAWDSMSRKGVSFALDNVQKLRDGDPLSRTATRPEMDFDAVVESESGGLFE